jgi:nitrate reductase delta subunit
LHREISAYDLREFIVCVERLELAELQELYTRTFDLNPACALEAGYHLFGENYKRGEFLAHLRETEAPFDLGQENQLPDYLPVLLRLLTKLDDDLRSSLISECLIPAIEKMLATFKDATNPYRFLLAVVRKRLQTEPGAQRTETVPTSFHVRASLPVLSGV